MMRQRSSPLVNICLPIMILAIAVMTSCQSKTKPGSGQKSAEKRKGVVIVDNVARAGVDIYMDGEIFTVYKYDPALKKPVLFPVKTAGGTEITRGFPIEPRIGERVDHLHHTGLWFNFGDVNGYDFWGNSSNKDDHKEKFGWIRHGGVKKAESREDIGILEVAADWQVFEEGKGIRTILQEQTIFKFSGDDKVRTIDRITRLTAQEDSVVFSDSKEGLYAIRLDRGLELPEEKASILIGNDGEPGEEPVQDNSLVSGEFLNSEGTEGLDVWGKKARWLTVSGIISEEEISVSLFDHPSNIGFPAYWMTRGYGLLAVNNLGRKVYDPDEEEFSLRLIAGESVVFKHRLYITSGYHASPGELEKEFAAFSKE